MQSWNTLSQSTALAEELVDIEQMPDSSFHALFGPGLAGNVSVGEGCLLGIKVSVIQGINIGA